MQPRHSRHQAHMARSSTIKPAFHEADTDTDILADILAMIVSRMSAFRSACHRNNFRKSRVSDKSARILVRVRLVENDILATILARKSAPWNASFTDILARMSRGCYKEKGPAEFELNP